MSRCIAEWKLAVYLDEELSPEEVRPIEAHLVGCRDCRALVVSLREEAELLSDVLQEREVRAPLAAAQPTRARGLALGVLPALAAVLALTSLLGWIFETAGGSTVDWLNPLRLRGATQMAFDFVFMLRDEAPGLFELVVAMAALGSVASLLTYAVTALSRRWLGSASLGIALVLVLGGATEPSHAHFGLHEHTNLLVGADEVHEGTLVAIYSENIDIDGVVTGDVIVLADRVTIRGEVQGNVFAGGQDVEVSGSVAGTLHSLAARTAITGRIGTNVYALTENLTLGESGVIGSDLWMRGMGGVIEGKVGRDVHAGGGWIEIRGEVARHLFAHELRVSVMPKARIGGNIDARLEAGEKLDIAPSAQVGGEVLSTEVERSRHGGFARFSDPEFYIWFGLRLAGAFAVGMLLHLVAPWLFGGRLDTAAEFFRCMGLGLLAIVVTPIVIVFTFATLAGIPLAFIGGAVFATAVYCAGILLAALIGGAILHPSSDSTAAFGLPLLLGLFVIVVGLSLPYVGGAVRVVTVLTGLGLAIERTRHAWRAGARPSKA